MKINNTDSIELTSKQTQKTFDLYKEIIKDDLFIKKKIFIDFRILKNFLAGYALAKVSSLEDKDMFRNILDIINSNAFTGRITDIPSIVFSEFPTLFEKSDSIECIYKYYSKFSDFSILSTVINTSFSRIVNNFINISKTNQQIIDNSVDITLTVNVFPFLFNTLTMMTLEEIFSTIYRIPAKMIYWNPLKVPLDFFKYDLLFLYDVEEILRHSYFKKEFNTLEEQKEYIKSLLEITVCSTKITNKLNVLKENDKKDIEEDFEFVKDFLSSFLDFYYLPPTDILTEEKT